MGRCRTAAAGAVYAQIDDDAFATAWAAGRAMTLEQAIAEAQRAPDEGAKRAGMPAHSAVENSRS
jgi:hypothetical protein